MKRGDAIGRAVAALLMAGALTSACEQARASAASGTGSGAPSSTAANGQWPNEPKEFVTVTDQPWNEIVRPAEPGVVDKLVARARNVFASETAAQNRWSYLRRSSSKDDQIIAGADAPFSPPGILRIVFTTDMQRDHEPSVHWIGLPRVTEVYSAWWMKLSPNWTCSPAGCGKIAFLFPENADGGVLYSNLSGTNELHYVNTVTTWKSTGYKLWHPNVTKTRVDNDRWYQVEWYVKWASSPDAADGILRWWVNGVLNGDYRDVPFPAVRSLVEFQYAPTRQDPPPTEQFLFIDHTRVSLPPAQVAKP